MKSQRVIILLAVVSIAFLGCKKEAQPIYDVSSLNVVNAAIGVQAASVNFTFTPVPYYQNAAIIGYSSYLENAKPSGNLPIEIFSSQDTIKPIYKNTLDLAAGGIYSLYLAGQSQAPEALLLKDNIPSYQDSTSGIRFINLSPGSQPVTINVQGSGTSQFGTLSYKQISDFKSFVAKSQNLSNGYVFEVRDAQNGVLLTTYTWTPRVSFCNTLVIDGLENDNTGNYPVSVFQVNHY